MKTNLTFGSNTNKQTLTVGGIVVAILVGGVMLLEIIMLRGEQVASDTFSLSQNPDPVFLGFKELPGEVLVSISSGTKKRQVALTVTVVDPEDRTVYQLEETFRHHGLRYFTFTPEETGDYKLYVRGESGLLGTVSGMASVQVFVNDRRFLWKLWRSKL